MSKRLRDAKKSISPERHCNVNEAIKFFTKDYFLSYKAGFDETIDFTIKLGINAKQSDQMVKGVVNIPNSLGKKLKIIVIVDSSRKEEVQNSGADMVGGEDLIQKIKQGFLDFEACIATPSMMPQVSSIGRLLGPKGLMPNPKFGTVTDNVALAIENIRKGQIKFRMDKTGIVHAGIAKISFKAEKVKENLMEFYNAILLAKPAKSKGVYVQGLFLSCTHGPSIKLDLRYLTD